MSDTISIPICIRQSKKKIFHFSLNNYTQVSKCPPLRAKLKRDYQEKIGILLNMIHNYETPVKITYTFFFKDKRRRDVNNIGAVTAKFFEDALVDAGKIEDDDYTHIPESTFRFGGIDKENPRADIFIERIL